MILSHWLWKSLQDVDSYIVYRSDDNRVANCVVLDTVKATTYLDSSEKLKLNPGKIYYYWVAGTRKSDIGPISTTGVGAFTKLKRITMVEASKGSSAGYISLKWSMSPLATGYNVFFDTLGSSGYSLLSKVGVEADDTTYSFTLTDYSSKFAQGGKYLFRVQPVNSYCTAAISDTSVVVDTGFLKLSSVDSFYFYYDSIRYDTIKLNWAVKKTANLRYYIYRSSTRGGTKILLDSIGVDTGYYYDKDVKTGGIERGKPYRYYITTALKGFEGAESDTVEVLTYNLASSISIYSGAWSLLGEPTGLKSSGEFNYATKDNVASNSFSDSIVVKWRKVANAGHYYLVGDTAKDFKYSDALYKKTISTGDTTYKFVVPELKVENLGQLLYFKVAALNFLDNYDASKARFTAPVKGFALLLTADSFKTG